MIRDLTVIIFQSSYGHRHTELDSGAVTMRYMVLMSHDLQIWMKLIVLMLNLSMLLRVYRAYSL